MRLHDPWHFPRPDVASHYIHLLADAPRRPLAVFGPRQVGKTHFLTHDMREAAADRGWLPVYVDLWGESDPLSALNTALASLLRGLQNQTRRTPVTSVGVLGVNVGMTAPAPLAQPADPAALLATQFAELRRLEPGKPVLLELDEAQTLGKAGAGDQAMKAVRAIFNTHPDGVLLLFTGSSKSQLLSLVGDHSKTAFKLAANLDFPVLGNSFVAFVAQRFKSITQREVSVTELNWAFSQLLHRPGEMIDFVRYIITEAPFMSVTEALDAFKARNQPDAFFEQQYADCTTLQQAVLVLVARESKMFSAATRALLAESIGHPALVPPASVSNALAQLEAKGLLCKRAGRGQYDFEDEHLRTWVDKVAGPRMP